MTPEEIAEKALELAKKEEELLLKEKELLGSDDEKVNKIVQAKLDESLKDIKDKLDKAYGARDAALKQVAEKEQKDREAELKRLTEEGKHKEVFDIQIAEEKARNAALEQRNIELTRDIEVRSALGAYVFRSDTALEMAYKEIVSVLVKSDVGTWVHKTGATIKDYVKAFSSDEGNAFLFKQAVSSGAGISNVITGNSGSVTRKSLFDMPQEEVLQLAREGKLRK